MILKCGECCGSGCDEVWQCTVTSVPRHHRCYYFLMKIEYQYNFYCDGFYSKDPGSKNPDATGSEHF